MVVQYPPSRRLETDVTAGHRSLKHRDAHAARISSVGIPSRIPINIWQNGPAVATKQHSRPVTYTVRLYFFILSKSVYYATHAHSQAATNTD